MPTEKYSLTWQTYSEHLRSMMKELMMNEDLADVTLVTEDKKLIKANMTILSACSPFFKKVLMKEQFSNSIMYLRGIQFSEMESIMQFIYLGEATFYEERIDELLAVAKLLEIKELCNAGADTETKTEEYYEAQSKPEEYYDTPYKPGDDYDTPSKPEDDYDTQTKSEEYFEPSTSDKVISIESEKSNDQIIRTENIKEQAIQERDTAVVCVKKEYKCGQCDKAYGRKNDLIKHIKSVHQGMHLHACDHCDYQALELRHLKTHIQSQHEGIKNFNCNQCEYKATYKSSLTYHIQTKHEGVRYSCDQCDHQSTTHYTLIRHIKTVHRRGENYKITQ